MFLDDQVMFYTGYELAFIKHKRVTCFRNILTLLLTIPQAVNSHQVNTLGYPPLPGATTQTCLNPNSIDKPVIYLYPTHTENVSVQVGYKPGFIKTEPSYNEQTGWQVEAQPNGTLTNLTNGKTYPYLFGRIPNPFSLHFDMFRL